MTAFDGRLRVLGQPGLPLGVEVDLTRDRMVVSTDGGPLAEWVLDDIVIYPTASGYRIDAEGEEVILNVTDSTAFDVALQNHLRPL